MASTEKKRRGTIRELSTFLKWEKANVIGHTIETIQNKPYVTKIWCKLCSRYKNELLAHPTCKGNAASSLKAFTDGTDVVTKHQVSTVKLHSFPL